MIACILGFMLWVTKESLEENHITIQLCLNKWLLVGWRTFLVPFCCLFLDFFYFFSSLYNLTSQFSFNQTFQW